jgi:hypothetical protein
MAQAMNNLVALAKLRLEFLAPNVTLSYLRVTDDTQKASFSQVYPIRLKGGFPNIVFTLMFPADVGVGCEPVHQRDGVDDLSFEADAPEYGVNLQLSSGGYHRTSILRGVPQPFLGHCAAYIPSNAFKLRINAYCERLKLPAALWGMRVLLRGTENPYSPAFVDVEQPDVGLIRFNTVTGHALEHGQEIHLTGGKGINIPRGYFKVRAPVFGTNRFSIGPLNRVPVFYEINFKYRPSSIAFKQYTAGGVLGLTTRDTGRPSGLRRGRRSGKSKLYSSLVG